MFVIPALRRRLKQEDDKSNHTGYLMKPYLKNSIFPNLGTYQIGRSVLEVVLCPFSLEVTQYCSCSSFMSTDVINYHGKRQHRGERVCFTSQLQVTVPHCGGVTEAGAVKDVKGLATSYYYHEQREMNVCLLIALSLLCPLLIWFNLHPQPLLKE